MMPFHWVIQQSATWLPSQLLPEVAAERGGPASCCDCRCGAEVGLQKEPSSGELFSGEIKRII
jgi:hypothetical protein